MTPNAAERARVRQLTERVLEHLDWAALGEIYFHWGGREFWQERRPQVLELGDVERLYVYHGGLSFLFSADLTRFSFDAHQSGCDTVSRRLGCSQRYVALQNADAVPPKYPLNSYCYYTERA